MSEMASPNEFTVSVEGIGSFTFAYRKMRHELSIAAEFSRICEGVETPNAFLNTVGDWISTLRVLTLQAPDGWDLDELDPLDSDDYGRLFRVYSALRAKEDSFRGRAVKTGEEAGQGVGEDPAVLVQKEVQPAAD